MPELLARTVQRGDPGAHAGAGGRGSRAPGRRGAGGGWRSPTRARFVGAAPPRAGGRRAAGGRRRVSAARARARASARPSRRWPGFLRKPRRSTQASSCDTGKGDFWVAVMKTPRPARRRGARRGDPAAACAASPGRNRCAGAARSDSPGCGRCSRIVCLFDGEVVPFDLRDGDDDGHGLAIGDLTEGHRFLAPGAFAVARLRRLGGEAARAPRGGRCRRAQARSSPKASPRSPPRRSCSVVDDPGLLDEVAGLVEWPVPLLGRIDDGLHGPAARGAAGLDAGATSATSRSATPTARLAPCFGFVANIEAARRRRGDRRRQRARAARALRRRPVLLGPGPQGARWRAACRRWTHVTFHAKLGTPGRAGAPAGAPGRARSRRMVGADAGAGASAPRGWPRPTSSPAWSASSPNCRASWAATTRCTTARTRLVADAIRDHYAPRGPDRRGARPRRCRSPWRWPTSSTRWSASSRSARSRPAPAIPIALRRAALGVIRIIRENGLRLQLRPADRGWPARAGITAACIRCRRRRCWTSSPSACGCSCARRACGTTWSPRCSPPAARTISSRLLARVEAVAALPRHRGRRQPADRLPARRQHPADRGAQGRPATTARRTRQLLRTAEERALARGVCEADRRRSRGALHDEDFGGAMAALAELRAPVDAFFDKVTVNAPKPDLRRNRLRLLHQSPGDDGPGRGFLARSRAEWSSHDQVGLQLRRRRGRGRRRHAQPAGRQGRQSGRDGRASACRCRRASPSPPRSAPSSTTTTRNYPDRAEGAGRRRRWPASRRRSGAKFGDPAQAAAGLGALRRARLDARHDGHRAQSRPQRRDRARASAQATGDERFAWDSYRRFIQMYGDVVLGVEHHQFEEITRARTRRTPA